MYFKNGYALLIGVGDHKDIRIPNLPAVSNDIKIVSKTLLDTQICGYHPDNVEVLTSANATKFNILQKIKWLSNISQNNPETTIFILFSGHGWLHESQYCFICYDTNIDKPIETSITELEMSEGIDSINSKKFSFFIDTCHAAGAVKDINHKYNSINSLPARINKINSILSAKSGKILIASCSENEKSFIKAPDYKFSIFSSALVEALSGNAHSYSDIIGILDIFNYLDNTVPKTAALQVNPLTGTPSEQHPVIQGYKSSNFPIAINKRMRTRDKDHITLIRMKELEKPLNLYRDQKNALEQDMALSTLDLQRQVILRERIRKIDEEIVIIEKELNALREKLGEENLL